jgi:hypothetical protein
MTQVSNLDQISQEELHKLFRKYTKKNPKKFTDVKIKQMLRVTFANKGITEAAINALAKIDKKKGDWREENFDFDYQFTKEELERLGKTLSRTCIERERVAQEKKDVNAEYKDKLDEKDAQISMLSRNIDKGSEHVKKTCDVLYDYDACFKVYFYNGTEVGRVRMEKKDYQTKAEFVD